MMALTLEEKQELLDKIDFEGGIYETFYCYGLSVTKDLILKTQIDTFINAVRELKRTLDNFGREIYLK